MPLPCQFAFDQIQFLTVDFWFSGKVVISKLTSCEDDPVLNNFLGFLAKDIENSPQNLVPMTVEKFVKISSLVEDIKIDLETPLDSDDDE